MGFRVLCKSHLFSALSSRHKTAHQTLLIQSLDSYLYNPSIDIPIYHIPRRWHLGHFHGHSDSRRPHHHHQDSGKEGEKIFRLGLAADVGLAAGKAFTGYLSGSTAIIADAAHSVSDVVLSGVALWPFKAGSAPRDKEHPYGHGKFESLGALGISCMLLATAGGIAWHALDLLTGLLSVSPEVVNHSLVQEHVHSHHHSGHHHGIDMDHPILALSMTIVSISVKEGLYWITKRAGEKQGSGLMKANAWHHRADAISSVVALIGVVFYLSSDKYIFWQHESPCLTSWYGPFSVLELVDAAIPAEDLDPINQTILKVEGVKGCHRLRGRRAGSSLHLDVHIEVDPFSSVSAAHGIGEKVRQEIHKCYPEIAEVFIHIDPSFLHFSPSAIDQHDNLQGTANDNRNNSLEDRDIEIIVSNIFLSKFSEKMEVERITSHCLQGKMVLEIEVSMPPNLLIRDAMEVAEAAEKEILKAASNVIEVSIQLRNLREPVRVWELNEWNFSNDKNHLELLVGRYGNVLNRG